MSFSIILSLKRNRPQQCELEYVSGDNLKPGFMLLDKKHPWYEPIKQSFLHSNLFDLKEKIALLVTFAKDEPFQFRLTDIYFTLHPSQSYIPRVSPFMMQQCNQNGIWETVPAPHAELAFSSIAKHTNHDFETLQQIEQGKIGFRINTVHAGEHLPTNAILPVQISKKEMQQIMQQHFNSWNHRLLKIKQILQGVLQLPGKVISYKNSAKVLKSFKDTLNFLIQNPGTSFNMSVIMHIWLLSVVAAENTKNIKIWFPMGTNLAEAITHDFTDFKNLWLYNGRPSYYFGEYIEELRLTAFNNPGNPENPLALKQYRKLFNQLQNEIAFPLLQPLLTEEVFDFQKKRQVEFMIKSVGMDIDHVFPNGMTLLAMMCLHPGFIYSKVLNMFLQWGRMPMQITLIKVLCTIVFIKREQTYSNF